MFHARVGWCSPFGVCRCLCVCVCMIAGGSSAVWPPRTSPTHSELSHAILTTHAARVALPGSNIAPGTAAHCTSFPVARLSPCLGPASSAWRTTVCGARSTRSRRRRRSGNRTRRRCAAWGSSRRRRPAQNTRSGNSEQRVALCAPPSPFDRHSRPPRQSAPRSLTAQLTGSSRLEPARATILDGRVDGQQLLIRVRALSFRLLCLPLFRALRSPPPQHRAANEPRACRPKPKPPLSSCRPSPASACVHSTLPVSSQLVRPGRARAQLALGWPPSSCVSGLGSLLQPSRSATLLFRSSTNVLRPGLLHTNDMILLSILSHASNYNRLTAAATGRCSLVASAVSHGNVNEGKGKQRRMHVSLPISVSFTSAVPRGLSLERVCLVCCRSSLFRRSSAPPSLRRPVRLNASTSNVRCRLQRTERGAECTAMHYAWCSECRGRSAQWTHCGTVLTGWDPLFVSGSLPLVRAQPGAGAEKAHSSARSASVRRHSSCRTGTHCDQHTHQHSLTHSLTRTHSLTATTRALHSLLTSGRSTRRTDERRRLRLSDPSGCGGRSADRRRRRQPVTRSATAPRLLAAPACGGMGGRQWRRWSGGGGSSSRSALVPLPVAARDASSGAGR